MTKPVFVCLREDHECSTCPDSPVWFRMDEIKAIGYDDIIDYPIEAYLALCSDGKWRQFWDTAELKEFLQLIDSSLTPEDVDETIAACGN